MHELHLAKDILARIIEEATAKGLSGVKSAKVAIGESRISDRAELEELFAMVSSGTLAEGILLEIEIKPLKAACYVCGAEFVSGAACEKCGSVNIHLTSGAGIEVIDLK